MDISYVVQNLILHVISIVTGFKVTFKLNRSVEVAFTALSSFIINLILLSRHCSPNTKRGWNCNLNANRMLSKKQNIKRVMLEF